MNIHNNEPINSLTTYDLYRTATPDNELRSYTALDEKLRNHHSET